MVPVSSRFACCCLPSEVAYSTIILQLANSSAFLKRNEARVTKKTFLKETISPHAFSEGYIYVCSTVADERRINPESMLPILS